MLISVINDFMILLFVVVKCLHKVEKMALERFYLILNERNIGLY